MAAVEAWFLGGPVDGRLMAVETTVGGHLPDVVTLPETDVYVGSSDLPDVVTLPETDVYVGSSDLPDAHGPR